MVVAVVGPLQASGGEVAHPPGPVGELVGELGPPPAGVPVEEPQVAGGGKRGGAAGPDPADGSAGGEGVAEEQGALRHLGVALKGLPGEAE